MTRTMVYSEKPNTFLHTTSDRYFNWVVRQRAVVLFTIIVLTACFLFFIPRMVFNTSVHDMVIENLAETRQYESFKEMFGSGEIIRVVITCDDVFDPATFMKIKRLAESLKTIEGVERTISLPDVKDAVDLSGNWSMNTFKMRVESIPLLQRNLISEDHRATLITLVLNQESDHGQLVAHIQEQIDKEGPDLTLFQMGMPVISDALARFTQKDFFKLPPFTFVVVAILLFFFLHNVRDVSLVLTCVTFSLIWTLGFIALTGMALSILTMIVPVFLIAVGTAYCLHIISEYQFQMERHPTSESATVAAFSTIILPTLLAAGTTILGLGSLFVSRISSIKAFAFIACGGMLSFVIIASTFLPAALSLFSLRTKRKKTMVWLSTFVQKALNGITSLNASYRKVTIPFLSLLMLLGVLGMFRLQVETNPVDYLKEGSPVRKNFDDIHSRLSGSLPINVVVDGKEEAYFEQIEAIEVLNQFQTFAETLPEVDKAVSFAEYLKLVNYATNRYKSDFYRLPTESFEVRMLINSYRMILGQEMLDAFLSPDASKANVMLFTHISSSKDILQLKEKIHAHAKINSPPGIQWEVTGFGVAIAASSSELTKGQIKSLLLTIGVVFGIMFMLFLSWKVGLIAIATNFFPIAMNFGIMGWMGIELSIATSLIASIAIGLAVDDTIHYLVRFNREFKKDLDSTRALRETINHVGRPIVYTTVTICIGFSVLLFSEFKPTSIFGAMMAITVFSALLGDLLLLPSLMQQMELVTMWDLIRVRMGKEPNLEIPLFKGLSRTEAHSIFMAGTLKRITADEILFEKGDPSDTMYAVISGRLEIIDYESDHRMAVAHGLQKHIRYAEKGDIVGEMGMLRSAPRSATVLAVESGELLPINWRVIRRLQWLYPPIALKFLNNLIFILCDRVESITHCVANESFLDDLTHLRNKKGLCKIIELEINRALRTGQSLMLWQFELTFHNESDPITNRIIQRLSTCLTRQIRGNDTLSRVDGKRFVLLTSYEKDDNLQPLRSRMQAAIEEVRIEFGKDAFDVDISAIDVPLNRNADGKEIFECTLGCEN